MLLRAAQQVNITENTVHAEHVLVFHVTAVAPFQHQYGQVVAAVLQQCGHVKFTGGVCNLAITHKLAVQPDIKTGSNTLKVQVGARGNFVLLVVKIIKISTAGVFFGHIRRVRGEGIADVGVLVVVVSVVLPYAGHRNGIIIRQVTAGGIKWVL